MLMLLVDFLHPLDFLDIHKFEPYIMTIIRSRDQLSFPTRE